jgi:hypothetical protein
VTMGQTHRRLEHGTCGAVTLSSLRSCVSVADVGLLHAATGGKRIAHLRLTHEGTAHVAVLGFKLSTGHLGRASPGVGAIARVGDRSDLGSCEVW